MNRCKAIIAAALLLKALSGCGEAPPPKPAGPEPGECRIAMLNTTAAMNQAWKAAEAGDWQAVEAHVKRMIPAFATAADLLPPTQKADHSAMLRELSGQRFPEMARATVDRNRDGFASAWRQTAAVCNTCHAATKTEFTVAPPAR